MLPHFRRAVFITICICALVSVSFANHLQVTFSGLTDQDTVSKIYHIPLSIYWENSWKDDINYDAVWVFAKYRVVTGSTPGDAKWRHATLTDFAAVVPVDCDSFIISKGAFVRKTTDGPSTVTLNGLKLTWHYGVDMKDPSQVVTDTDPVEFRVYAIEMVNVPQSTFQVGDGTNTDFGNLCQANSPPNPFTITSEGALTLGGTSAGNLGSMNFINQPGVQADDFTSVTTQALPAGFPKGFAGFYCMKYEITSEQYRDFLNTLTRVQQNARTDNTIANGAFIFGGATRASHIRCPAVVPGGGTPVVFGCDYNQNGVINEADDGLGIAQGHLLWSHIAAYLDWAALRPMTELEYEKACRGPAAPSLGEYAWGTSVFNATLQTTLQNDGTESETFGASNTNVYYLGNNTVRSGVFAKDNTTREQAGASYWGIMELTGNAIDCAISIGTATNRAFTAVHGDGAIADNGDADAATWPAASANVGGRGGTYGISSQIKTRITTSNRDDANLLDLTNVCYPQAGGRGVRNLP